MKQFLILMAVLALVGCASDADLSYSIGWDATPEERESIRVSFQQWSDATGEPTWETDPGSSVFTLVLGDPGSGNFALNSKHWRWDLDWDNQWHKVFVRSTITVQYSSESWPGDYWIGIMLHEIGHGLDLNHSDNPDSVMCSSRDFPGVKCVRPIVLDVESIRQANHNLDNGWFG